ncbi:regulatory protein [Noviherbaspirillum humi]|uniref:Regulatory protein RecX n=1 Tax=Noviherbaspirillum humi TaxID=1688639 RepID=A0A239E2L9_9BURK|nr:recombination regulator RecX [Noviherbaspirillum humi]SNS38980.1 regulatory protein [Noviherbaspirillum humi]
MAKLQMSLKARALKYLSMREHSRMELGRKLARYAQDDDDVEGLLDWLEASKFLSAARFSESLVHRRAARFGNSRILSELGSHGIAAEVVEEVKEQLVQDEATRAFEVWQRKFGTPAEDAAGHAKQLRFLLQRGFSQTSIQKIFRAVKAGRNTLEDDE